MRCGSCKICCFVTRVPELNKPENTWCRFCSTQERCLIYGKHPPSCKSFSCFWYRHKELSEELRPDKCRVMIEVLDGISTYAAYVDPAFPKAWTSIIVDSVFKDILNNGHPIFLGVGKERHLLLPKGRTVKEVHDELSDFMFKLGEKNNGSSLIYH